MSGPPAPLRVLVVDDEAPARGELAYLLRHARGVDRVLEAGDPAACLATVEREPVDVVFLDVRMPGLDGLALARVLARAPAPPQVVFVTAFEGYAVDAFQLAAFDYLLKPVRPERLRMTLDRLALARRPAPVAAGAGPPAEEAGLDDRLAVSHRGQVLLVPVEEIRVAEGGGDRVVVRTPTGHYPARVTLSELERRLEGRGFLRVHRRYIVNLRHVLAVQTFFNSTYLLQMHGLAGYSVPVSRRHGAALRAAIRL